MIFDIGHPNGIYRITELNYEEDFYDVINSLMKLDAMINSTMNPTLIKVKCYWNEMLKCHDNVYLVYFYTTKEKVDIPFSKICINSSSSYSSSSEEIEENEETEKIEEIGVEESEESSEFIYCYISE